jgi:hypothetical protein
MLKEEERRFVVYWESVRDEQARFVSKLFGGLPMALIFSLPILSSVAIVYFVFPEWYTKISQKAFTVTYSIVIAVFLAALFFAFFRMQFKWEMNEQLYQELKKKSDQSKEVV